MKRLLRATAWILWTATGPLLPASALAWSASEACAGLADGAACDDGNACSVGDTCSQGVCEGGPALNCDDGNSCTQEVCDPSIGCRRSNHGDPCDDGSTCTADDTCVPGTVPSATVSGPMQCWGGYLAPQCNAAPIDAVGDVAAQAHGARPAVASSTLAGYPLIHRPAHLNDGYVGNGSSWIGASANAWAKIDLGQAMPIHAFSFGRDRTGGYDERDPGQFTLSVALTDNVYANGDASGDATEYTVVYDSEQQGFSGLVAGAQTVQGQFATVLARYVKIQVATDGAAIDELQVYSAFVAGACVGQVISCDDGDVCTADSCHPQAGCQHVVMVAGGEAGLGGSCSDAGTQVEVPWTPWSFAVFAGEALALGHDVVVQGELASLGALELEQGGTVSGAVYASGQADIAKDTTLAGGLYTSAGLDPKCAVEPLGPVPAAMPGAPVIDTAYYASLLASAEQGGVQGGKWQGLTLNGGTLQVHGSFHLAKGTLTGPGVVVATGSIHLGHGVQVGAGVTLVAGGELVVGKGVTVGDQALLHAGKAVAIQHQALLVGARIVSAGDIALQHDVSFTGLLAAAGDVVIGHACEIVGSVMARGEVEIGHTVSIAHDAAAAGSLPPGVSVGVSAGK